MKWHDCSKTCLTTIKISLVLTGVLTFAAVASAAEDTWTRKADMPTRGFSHSVSAVDGKMYSIGGGSAANAIVSIVEEYDPVTDTWTTKTPMPTALWGLSTSVVGGKIYAIGGARSVMAGSIVSTVQQYDTGMTVPPDFNGEIDAKDMALLVDNWGKNNPLCDIGPFPGGDGVVDEKDLRVLMESLMIPGPKASDVPCDVILSWISPSFANTCDVYLGTSFDAVDAASRADPQGALVSQGQTASTYTPAGLLEFDRTYYWRVDFVISGPTPTIIKGPILKFTTAALTYPIKNITAKASSASPGNGPERTVDGSGLDKSDGHSTDPKDMWWSMAEPSHWIQYEFDKVYTLHELGVWNFNQAVEPFIGFGAKTVQIEYSTDGTTWTSLADVPEFAKAPGKPGYTPNTIVSFAGVPAKFVKLTIEKNWGVAPRTGLSEVRFFCIQSTAAPKP